jgi:hypothetical protein
MAPAGKTKGAINQQAQLNPLSSIRPPIQAKLAISQPGDPLEQEADRIAEKVMAMPLSPPPQERAPLTQLQRSSAQAISSPVPPIVHDVLRSPGAPLDAATRAFMEPRFGYNFGQVRVHTDPEAARSAKIVGAAAYTVGSDVVFGSERYAPASRDGQLLLAHELTHVIHQRASTLHMQLKPDPQQSPGVQLLYSISIDKMLNSEKLLLEAIKQYRHVATDVEAEELRTKENWQWTKIPIVKKADVDKGYILVTITDQTITPITETEKKERDKYFKGLSQGEQANINAEADRQFWEKTKYRVGKKLGASADDKKMTEYRKLLRYELIRKGQVIEALPLNIQEFLFDEEAPVTLDPKDFETALRIASKVMALTPAELAEYKSRVTARTNDWSVYDAAIDRFLAERKERETTAKEKMNIETRLSGEGILALHDRYQNYKSMSSRNSIMGGLNNPRAVGVALGMLPTLNKIRAELEVDLIKAGFPGGIPDFKKFIHDYENLFERETLAIARIMLDRYEHLLWTEEQRYQNPKMADDLYQTVGQTKARAEYEEADKIRSEHAQIPWTLEESAEQSYWSGQRKEALARGEHNILSASAAHPLIGNSDFDRERLARASSKGDVQSLMLTYIAERKKNIADTRKNLTDKPTMIYGLVTLLEASFQVQNIQNGTIYYRIIQDHKEDVHWSEAIPQIILAVIAVAAGLLSGVGGAIAVLATGSLLGIGAYQAIDEFRRYEMKSAAYGSQLTSEDPTMAWVIVAVIGAGFDAAAFASVLPKLRPALEAFNAGAEAGDIAMLERKLANIPRDPKLGEVEENIIKNIIRGAGAEVEARAAWKTVIKLPAGLIRSTVLPGAERFGRFVYAVYLSTKRGIRSFQVFIKTNEAVELIGKAANLTAEELAAVKTGYLKAIEEMETVALHGKAIGMAENEISGFMKLRGETEGMTVEQVVKDMDAWIATAQGGLPARPLGKSSKIADEDVMIALEKQAAGKSLWPGEQLLLNKLKGYDTSDLRVAWAVRAKGGATIEQFNITVARDSAEYKGVLGELEKFKVGRAKGFEDRQIVCDSFFAKTDPGVKPVLLTHDKGIYNRLLLMKGIDPAKLGKSVAEAFPAGFDVTVKGRTITVLPLPGR